MRYLGFTLLIVSIIPESGCIEPYTPPEIVNDNQYLVVEGYLDAATGSSTIELSQTIPLSGGDVAESVTNAVVVIEDELNHRYFFTEPVEGVYIIENIPVDPDRLYRLKVTKENDEYVSDYVKVTMTPAIDSVFWRLEGDKIKIYVNTHNDGEGTRYYFWKYIETWEYSSAFRSYYKYEDGLFKFRDSPDEIYYCWKMNPSTNINLATTAALEKDVVKDYLLREYNLSSKEFQRKYSIQVIQHSLTKEAYEFWSQVRENTQGMGTLFDIQPSRVTGNISNENGKPAIGYFSVGTVQEARIYIRDNELPVREIETDYKFCGIDSLLIADFPSFEGKEIVVDRLVEYIEQGPRVPPLEIFLGYTISSRFCADCRAQGGTNERPVFWD